jgi:hypothetical protein
MILSASLLDTLDRCPRRSAFEQEYEVRTISPAGLMYAAIEGSLTAVDPIQGAKDAIHERTSRLDVTCGELSPISVVRHVESVAEAVALALRAKLGHASTVPVVNVGEHQWQSNLFEFRGELHRIVLVSYMGDDSLRSFAHAWGTIGELAALERPLTLTAIILGAQRNGRRHSHWAKAFQHPVQKSALRFAPRSRDDGFTKGWKPVWREQTEISAQTWLDRMRGDDVLDELIVSRRIQYRADDERMRQARCDIAILADQLQDACTDAPMRRSSCDEVGRDACPFQRVCYSPVAITPEELPHLYRLRETLPARQE